MIRILVADDHAIVRRGLKQIIQDQPDWAIVAEAATGAQALDRVRQFDCDVVLLDVSLPDRSGVEILKELKALRPNLPVLMISIHPEDQYAVRTLKAGASGYLCKGSTPEELVTAIRQVLRGGKYVSDTLAQSLAADLDRNLEQPRHALLSDREYQVLLLIASGKSISQIAVELALNAKTISTYRARLLHKMNMTANAELVRYALENHLIS